MRLGNQMNEVNGNLTAVLSCAEGSLFTIHEGSTITAVFSGH